MIRSLPVPLGCLLQILLHSLPVLVHAADAEFRIRTALSHTQSEPPEGLAVILRDSASRQVHGTQLGKRAGMVLIRRLPEPFKGFGAVLGHSHSVSIHRAYHVLRSGDALLRSLQKPAGRLLLAPRDAEPAHVHGSEAAHSDSVAFLRISPALLSVHAGLRAGHRHFVSLSAPRL